MVADMNVELANDTQKLFTRGLKDFFPGKPEDMLRELAQGMSNGKYKIFLIGLHTFGILTLPATAFDLPQVLHIYSEKKGCTHALLTAMVDFARKQGYTTVRAVNGSGIDDETWTHIFRHESLEIQPVKTVFDFKVLA